MGGAKVRVSLFVTCLVDQLFPQVAESAVRILERLGVEVRFPLEQTCCDQPAFNSGYWKEAKDQTRRFLDTFGDSEYVVAPSGSCVSMVSVFYPELLRDEPELLERARRLAPRVYELSQFLVDVLGVTRVPSVYSGVITYHASCHLLRELGVVDAPRLLLQGVQQAKFVELPRWDQCCGFGGTFSVKFPHISQAIVAEKIRCLKESGADTLVTCDAGCMMHISGALKRQGLPIKVMHLAEILDIVPGGRGGD